MVSGKDPAIHVGEESLENEKIVVYLWGFVIISVWQYFVNRKSTNHNI